MNQHLSINQTEVNLPTGEVGLDGTLNLLDETRGIVVFAHGSGSSRNSPRNRFVAEMLNDSGQGTLLFDLLTPDEQRIDDSTRHLRFDIGLLASRLVGVLDWLGQFGASRGLPIGLFGASTGAAAALVAAAQRPKIVCAVVSRGGRPDLAGENLAAVEAPTLLIVGENDPVVIKLNREASRLFHAPHQLTIVPGASHLFEEPGTLAEAARLARDWFLEHFSMPE